MKNIDQAHEESMEEILASIRRIIADDDDALPSPGTSRPQPQPAAAVPAGKQSSHAAPGGERGGSAAASSFPAPQAGAAAADEPEILELSEEYLIFEEDRSYFEPQTPAASEDSVQRLPSPSLDQPSMVAGQRRLWDEQAPIKLRTPPPKNEERLKPAVAPQQKPSNADHVPHAAVRRPAAHTPAERSPVRPAWSSRGLSALHGAPASDAPPRPAVAPAVDPSHEPASLWQHAPDRDAWPENVQMPVPKSGPAAPFPSLNAPKPAEERSTPAPAARGVPHTASPAQTAAKPAFTAAPAPASAHPASSRIAAPVTQDGSPGVTAGQFAKRTPLAAAQAVVSEPAADASATQYLQEMAQELTRAAVGGLGDHELAEANRIKLTDANRPAFAGVAQSIAHALSQQNADPGMAGDDLTKSIGRARASIEAATTDAVYSQQGFADDAKPEQEAELSSSGLQPANLEDSFKALLRPMLRDWLNENMPRLLEQAIAEEVKRRLDGGE